MPKKLSKNEKEMNELDRKMRARQKTHAPKVKVAEKVASGEQIPKIVRKGMSRKELKAARG